MIIALFFSRMLLDLNINNPFIGIVIGHVLSPSARVAKKLDTIEETLEQYADQFPVNAPVERWKSTLQSLRLMDTMNRSTTGSEHKNRLEKLQTQTEALFNEIFQSLDSGDAQIED